MTDTSKQPTTWSYKTTKVLVACFIFFLIMPIIGIISQQDNIEQISNPEKEHVSHLISLENNNSEKITLYPNNFYSVYVKSENKNNINKENILLIDVNTQNELKSTELPIFKDIPTENGDSYTAVHTWTFNDIHEVELQNTAGEKVWLINESAIFTSLKENDILIGSVFGCLTSICLIPVIIIWFVINRPNSKTLAIKFLTEEQEQPNHIQLLQYQKRIPNSDELYQSVHGNDEMKNNLKNKIEEEIIQESIPAPFADRPDKLISEKENNILSKDNNLPKVVDFPEEKPKEAWKDWDG